MVKVKMSQIPEDDPIVKIKNRNTEKSQEGVNDSNNSEEEEDDDEKTYFRTLINIPEAGVIINSRNIHSIRKTFRLRESFSNFDSEGVPEYGILINEGMLQGTNSPKPDTEIWYENEKYRDQRYDKLKSVLDQVGIKVITL